MRIRKPPCSPSATAILSAPLPLLSGSASIRCSTLSCRWKVAYPSLLSHFIAEAGSAPMDFRNIGSVVAVKADNPTARSWKTPKGLLTGPTRTPGDATTENCPNRSSQSFLTSASGAGSTSRQQTRLFSKNVASRKSAALLGAVYTVLSTENETTSYLATSLRRSTFQGRMLGIRPFEVIIRKNARYSRLMTTMQNPWIPAAECFRQAFIDWCSTRPDPPTHPHIHTLPHTHTQTLTQRRTQTETEEEA